MFSGAKAFCLAGFINGGTSERTIPSEALIASQNAWCIPFLRTLKQLRSSGWSMWLQWGGKISNFTLCSRHNFATSSCLWLPCPSRHRRNHPYCSNGCCSRSCRRNIVRHLTNQLSSIHPLGTLSIPSNCLTALMIALGTPPFPLKMNKGGKECHQNRQMQQLWYALAALQLSMIVGRQSLHCIQQLSFCSLGQNAWMFHQDCQCWWPHQYGGHSGNSVIGFLHYQLQLLIETRHWGFKATNWFHASQTFIY